MQAERDELVLRVFPELRRLCEARGVTLVEVDLRWGISEERSQRDEVLCACLDEVDRCRPYFIGLLGERYGWIPSQVPTAAVERDTWLAERDFREKSMTELEILRGVLEEPENAQHAFFYFRDPAYVETVAPEQRPDVASENALSAARLARLKDRIRLSHRYGRLRSPPRENYSDPKALGRLVLADFTALIESSYPAGAEPSALERERMAHEAFARSRARAYVARQGDFARLDAHVAGGAPPLVVLGVSGCGKSALLANWALRHREEHPSDLVIQHFVGASPRSTDATAILRRIMLETQQRFAVADQVPNDPRRVRDEFPAWLAKLPSSFRVVLVLDALNQVEDIDGALDLGWLPEAFPRHCRVIVSTLPGRTLDAIARRGWPAASPPLTVRELDEGERLRLTQSYLAQFARDLGHARTELLLRAPQTKNPLYLRVLLDELRVFGSHEGLTERMLWYLEATTAQDLYRKVIGRWEDAYSNGTTLVSDTLRLLWAARGGLSEAEILDALGEPGRPMPRALWSPLFLAMSESLVNRSGLWSFTHDFLRAAVRDALLPTEADRRAAHRRLAVTFQRVPRWSERKLDELPWQLAAARDWHELHSVLTEQGCFLALRRRRQFELVEYWAQLGPAFDPAESYLAAFDGWFPAGGPAPEASVVASEVGLFLQDAARHDAAECMLRRALELGESAWGPYHTETAICLNNLALVLHATNQLAAAEALMRRALAIDDGHQSPNLSTKLVSLGRLLSELGRFTDAEPLFRRALEIDERNLGPNHPLVGRDLSDLAGTLQALERFAEAETLHRHALSNAESNFGTEHPDVAASLSNLANVLHHTRRLDEAEPLHRRALDIDERAFGPHHPQVATKLNNLGLLHYLAGRATEAEPLLRRALAIDEAALGPEHSRAATKLENLGLVLHAGQRHAEAEALFRRALTIREKVYGPEHRVVAASLYHLAVALEATDRVAEAVPLVERSLAIAELCHGRDHAEVAKRLGSLAQMLCASDRSPEAIPLFERLLAMRERTGHAADLEFVVLLNNLAHSLQAANRFAEAEPRLRRAIEIAERHHGNDHETVAALVRNLVRLLADSGRTREAESVSKRQLEVFLKLTRTTGRLHPGLPRAAAEYAGLLRALGCSEEQALEGVNRVARNHGMALG